MSNLWLPFQGPSYHLKFTRVNKKRLLVYNKVQIVAYKYIDECSSQEGFLEILPDTAICTPNALPMFLINGLSPAKNLQRPFPGNIITDGQQWYPLIFSLDHMWRGRIEYAKMGSPRILTIWDQEKIVDAIQAHIGGTFNE